MKRVPEPELMLDPAQAAAYAKADFAAPHDAFVATLLERSPGLPPSGAALDLGCGPGDPLLRLAERLPAWQLHGVDGSPAMLAEGRAAVAARGLEARVTFHEARLPDAPASLGGRRFELVLSNSLLHHLAEPASLWSALRRFAAPGGHVFVMDLARPADEDRVRELVARYAAGEPAVLRRDFHHSLRAAYRLDEVRAQLREAGLAGLRSETLGDRHWIVWGVLG